ncbi:MAG: hypothetical protein GEV00_16955, partial [Actinophytocola sp.]|nr:hypothetical protein [Actinophytocola sp.]
MRRRYLFYNPFVMPALRNAVRLAKRIYGPYQLHALPLQLGADPVPGGERVEELSAVGGTVDVVLNRILTARSLAAIGALTLAVELTLVVDWRWTWLGEWAYSTAEKGLYMMLIAPPAVYVTVLGLVLAARPGRRRTTLQSGVRPIVVATFTVLFVAGLVWMADAIRRGRDPFYPYTWLTEEASGDLLTMALVFVVSFVFALGLIWFTTFLGAAIYLAQRNGMSQDRSLPLLPPLVAVCVAWAYFGLTGWLDLDPDHLTGWRAAFSWYGPPVAVTILAIVEIARLRHKHRIGFRGSLEVRS